MANGNYHNFKGTGKWMHRLFEEDQEYNYYGLDFYPDKKSLEAYVKAGCMGDIREDKETGEEFVKLRRKPQLLTRAGKLIDFGKPKVTDKDGQPWPEGKVIGNGSGLEVTVVTYPTVKGIGTRLESVKVVDWHEYIAPEQEAA